MLTLKDNLGCKKRFTSEARLKNTNLNVHSTEINKERNKIDVIISVAL